MAGGESATGISNARYNLVSVLYHALEGGATYEKYIQDAENEGDQELADFFRQVQQEDAQRAAGEVAARPAVEQETRTPREPGAYGPGFIVSR